MAPKEWWIYTTTAFIKYFWCANCVINAMSLFVRLKVAVLNLHLPGSIQSNSWGSWLSEILYRKCILHTEIHILSLFCFNKHLLFQSLTLTHKHVSAHSTIVENYVLQLLKMEETANSSQSFITQRGTVLSLVLNFKCFNCHTQQQQQRPCLVFSCKSKTTLLSIHFQNISNPNVVLDVEKHLMH